MSTLYKKHLLCYNLYLLFYMIYGTMPPFGTIWYAEKMEEMLWSTQEYTIWNLTTLHGTTVNILTQFEAIPLQSIGDNVTLQFEWISNGTNVCEPKYWQESQYNYQCEEIGNGFENGSYLSCAENSVNCLKGTGDFRIALFASNGIKISASNYTENIFSNMTGYELRIFPHLSNYATRYSDNGDVQKPCAWYLRMNSQKDPFGKTQIGNWTGCFNINIGKSYNFELKIEKVHDNGMYLNGQMNSWSINSFHEWNKTDNITQFIPSYIDTMVIEFPNERSYQFIKLGYIQ
eukprot:358469_1